MEAKSISHEVTYSWHPMPLWDIIQIRQVCPARTLIFTH